MATEYFDNSITGEPRKVIDQLKAKCRYFCKDATAEYIGMTSGEVESRMDDYKKHLEINEIRILYSTPNREDAVEVERKLIDYSKKNSTINANINNGGGGRLPETGDNTYQVYAAYRRL